MKELDLRIKDKYKLVRRLGGGSWAEVYLANDLQTNEQVAVKLEYLGNEDELLRREVEVYRDLQGGVGIPKVHWYGYECDFTVLALDVLGPSLEDLLNFCGRRFSHKTLLLLADQLLSRLEHIHKRSYIHRDLKPENLLMGAGRFGNLVYIIDFGLAKLYRDPDDHQHNDMGSRRTFGGTMEFASINNHGGFEQSRRDDLEGLGYILVYLCTGSLPWSELAAGDSEDRGQLVMESKINTTLEDLCHECPKPLLPYMKYVRALSFTDEPDYAHLRKIFRDHFSSCAFKFDNLFDWTIKKFNMLRGKSEDEDTELESSTTTGALPKGAEDLQREDKRTREPSETPPDDQVDIPKSSPPLRRGKLPPASSTKSYHRSIPAQVSSSSRGSQDGYNSPGAKSSGDGIEGFRWGTDVTLTGRDSPKHLRDCKCNVSRF